MNHLLTIEINGTPVPKGRGRVGKLKNGRAIVFTPEKTRTFEHYASTVAKRHMIGYAPIEKPIMLKLDLVFSVPDSWPKWKKQAALEEKIMHTCKPDSDNCLKAIKDAFNKIVWNDDSQVVKTSVSKTYGLKAKSVASISIFKAFPSSITKQSDMQEYLL